MYFSSIMDSLPIVLFGFGSMSRSSSGNREKREIDDKRSSDSELAMEADRLSKIIGRATVLPEKFAALYRAQKGDRTRLLIASWLTWTATLNLFSLLTDFEIVPPHAIAFVVAARLVISITMVFGAAVVYRNSSERLENCILVLTTSVLMALAGWGGLVAGGELFERYLVNAAFVVSTAVVLLPVTFATSSVVSAVAVSAMAGFLAVSPGQTIYECAQIASFHGAAFLALLLARSVQNGMQHRYFLMRLRLDAQVAELSRVNSLLKHLSMRDPLTNLANRRSFDEDFKLLYEDVRRGSGRLVVCMIDVDYFKLLNDHFGHTSGDDCLRRVAINLSSNMRRETDLLARYGGEEFVVVARFADEDDSHDFADRLRAGIEAARLVNPRAPAGIVTASVGVVEDDCKSVSIDALIARADASLYLAKAAGRNRVCVDGRL